MQLIVADDSARWVWDEQDLLDALRTACRLLSKSVAGIDMIEGRTARRMEEPRVATELRSMRTAVPILTLGGCTNHLECYGAPLPFKDMVDRALYGACLVQPALLGLSTRSSFRPVLQRLNQRSLD